MTCDMCGETDDVVQCPQCETPVCWACRPNEICPCCGGSVDANAKCSLTGGCGDGSQEEP